MFIFQGDEKAKIQASVDENIRKIKEYEYEDTIHTLEKKECTANPKYQSKDNIEDKHITIEVQMTEKEAAKKITNEYGEAKRGNNLEKVQTSLIGSKPWHPTNIKSDTESLKIGITNVPTLSQAVLNMFVETENQISQNNEVANYSEDLNIPDSLHSSDKPTDRKIRIETSNIQHVLVSMWTRQFLQNPTFRSPYFSRHQHSYNCSACFGKGVV